MQQSMQLLHCILQSRSKRTVSSIHWKQLDGWTAYRSSIQDHQRAAARMHCIATSRAGGCWGDGRQTHLVDSWPDFGHGQDAGLNLLWAEIADTYASDQSFLNTLF